MGMPAARAASSTGRVAWAAAAIPLMSMPARSNMPPDAAKSFCASITITATRRGSRSSGAGRASSLSIAADHRRVRSRRLKSCAETWRTACLKASRPPTDSQSHDKANRSPRCRLYRCPRGRATGCGQDTSAHRCRQGRHRGAMLGSRPAASIRLTLDVHVEALPVRRAIRPSTSRPTFSTERCRLFGPRPASPAHARRRS